jgi:hypothetical protein
LTFFPAGHSGCEWFGIDGRSASGWQFGSVESDGEWLVWHKFSQHGLIELNARWSQTPFSIAIGSYNVYEVARLTTGMHLSGMQPPMKPSDAFSKMAHRRSNVAIDDLEDRVTSIRLTPYPPGIPLLIPGERFNKTIVDYLRFARDFNEKFPGFETDVHGLVTREVDGKRGYFVDCVRQ